MNKVYKVLIIGAGPAGLTAAIYTGRARLEPIVFAGPKPGGQLMGTTMVENWPGTGPIMGPELMINMQKQAESMGAQVVYQTVEKVDLSKQPYTVTTNKDETFSCESMIIATGATSKTLGVPGEEQYWGKGVTVCAVCDGAFYVDKQVIVVGGGDTAMEDASFLTKFTDKVTIVHIKSELTASKPMQERVLNNPKIKIIYNSTVSEIQGNNSHVTGATVTNIETKQRQELPADGIFIAIGLNPATAPFKGQLPLTQYGYLLTNKEVYTDKSGVFVAGDCADYIYRQAITSAGAGCMAALACERYLAGQQ